MGYFDFLKPKKNKNNQVEKVIKLLKSREDQYDLEYKKIFNNSFIFQHEPNIKIEEYKKNLRLESNVSFFDEVYNIPGKSQYVSHELMCDVGIHSNVNFKCSTCFQNNKPYTQNIKAIYRNDDYLITSLFEIMLASSFWKKQNRNDNVQELVHYKNELSAVLFNKERRVATAVAAYSCHERCYIC